MVQEQYSDVYKLRDYLAFLVKHKRSIQAGITVSEGEHSIACLSVGVCENIPDRLAYVYVDLVKGASENEFYPVDGTNGDTSQQTYQRYKMGRTNMYGYDEYSQRRWAMIASALAKCNDLIKQVEVNEKVKDD